jgi:hypothetical protein
MLAAELVGDAGGVGSRSRGETMTSVRPPPSSVSARASALIRSVDVDPRFDAEGGGEDGGGGGGGVTVRRLLCPETATGPIVRLIWLARRPDGADGREELVPTPSEASMPIA